MSTAEVVMLCVYVAVCAFCVGAAADDAWTASLLKKRGYCLGCLLGFKCAVTKRKENDQWHTVGADLGVKMHD